MNHSFLLLTALTMIFGAHLLRVLLPALTWYWGATRSLSAWQVAAANYAPVILALPAPLLARRLGLGRTLRVCGVALLVCRVLEQFSMWMAVDVWLAMVGAACFMGMLPLLFARAASEGQSGWSAFGLGLLLGLSLDTALRGATGTLDLSWIPGVWPALVVLALASGFAVTLWRITAAPVSYPGKSWRVSRPLIGIGLLLFVEWLILQSQGWVTTLTGWGPAPALAWMTLGNAASFAAASLAIRRGWLRKRGWALLAGLALTLAMLAAQVSGWVFAVGLLAGLVSAGCLLVAIVVGVGQEPTQPAGAAGLSLAFGLALFIWSSLTLVYYLSFLMPLLPVPRTALPLLAALGLAASALAVRPVRPKTAAATLDWLPAGLALLMLLVPLGRIVPESLAMPAPPSASGSPVRVMTYNIRSGFGQSGRLDIDAPASVIRSADADVVGLQEVSRGWLITGGTDLLPLIARRLQMPHTIWGPATHPLFGNALASQGAPLASGHGTLPGLDTLVPRGYVWAELDWEAGDSLLIINTHLDSDRQDVRLAQIEGLLAAWASRGRTVLVGDMNALPGSAEIERILAAGFVDAWAETGQPARPRIDYIFHTPDLLAREVAVIDSPASDHPAYAATISAPP
jgi:endonuclease/exonuclease/phosphatase family metal-dependent hydrolase